MESSSNSERMPTLEKYKRQYAELNGKIEQCNRDEAAEMSEKLQLKLALSRLHQSINELKQDVSRLERERDLLADSNIGVMSFSKRARNYQAITSLRRELKDSWITNMEYKLQALDFAVAQKEEDQSGGGLSNLTQYPSIND